MIDKSNRSTPPTLAMLFDSPDESTDSSLFERPNSPLFTPFSPEAGSPLIVMRPPVYAPPKHPSIESPEERQPMRPSYAVAPSSSARIMGRQVSLCANCRTAIPPDIQRARSTTSPLNVTGRQRPRNAIERARFESTPEIEGIPEVEGTLQHEGKRARMMRRIERAKGAFNEQLHALKLRFARK